MADTINFELVSPERLLVSEEVDSITLPASNGDMTILGNHAPVMTTLRPGVLTVTRTGGGRDEFVVFGGFADVTVGGCTVLAEDARPRGEVSREELRERISAAQKDYDDASGGDDNERKTRAEEFLGQLTTLDQTILPA